MARLQIRQKDSRCLIFAAYKVASCRGDAVNLFLDSEFTFGRSCAELSNNSARMIDEIISCESNHRACLKARAFWTAKQ